MTRFLSAGLTAVPLALSVTALSVFALVASTLSFPPAASAQVAAPVPVNSKVGDVKQFDRIRVTLDSFAIDGPKADVVLRMENLSDEEKSIAFLLFVEAQAESGEYGDYDYHRTHCDGPIPPHGQFTCSLALIFPAPPETITLRVGEGMAAEVISFSLAP
ncbi:hypothetical protein A7A08_00553 [Methyloligella halotolerans]|uniref:Telomeric repeat-binding factor 2 n=1 Tax=Methyloligella halotolerans TaxID=1177755 RepID=A0A1E2S2Q2_9HYPH|nr:hypothetical protein [Methyloligella halotolerans]ODA68721.1 hypothetical protein A7A08_00553 [Methyloligella halotolerans]